MFGERLGGQSAGVGAAYRKRFSAFYLPYGVTTGRDAVARNGSCPCSPRGFFYLAVPDEWNRVGASNPRLLALVKRFKATGTSVTPTLHVFAEPIGLAWFSVPPRDQNEGRITLL